MLSAKKSVAAAGGGEGAGGEALADCTRSLIDKVIGELVLGAFSPLQWALDAPVRILWENTRNKGCLSLFSPGM